MIVDVSHSIGPEQYFTEYVWTLFFFIVLERIIFDF